MSTLPPDPAAPVDPDWAATEFIPRPMASKHGNALPTGSHLAEFELLRVLGEGGFGIVYLAYDHSLQRRVAIKEYMPASLAMRSGPHEVVVTSERHRAVFDAGLESFVNEARLLAQFDHPSLLKVYRFWRDHGTAYMVMPFYEGVTLKDQLKQMGSPPDERWLTTLLGPLTEALMVIHAEHCLHRDIAPDNILLLADSGRPLLLDFGAARQVIGDATQALTAILKPGYAPVEQYAEVASLKQGTWTDVYALCAVMYAAMTGSKPPVSVARTVADGYVPLMQCAEGRYSRPFLQAIDEGLRVRPDERTRSVAALRQALGLDEATILVAPPAAAAARVPPPAPAPRGMPATATTPLHAGWSRSTQAGIAMLVLVVAGGCSFWAAQPQSMHTAISPAAPAPVVVTAPTAPAAAATPAMFSVVGEFDRVMQASRSDFKVQASAAQSRLRIARDRLAFKVSAGRSGHVYVLVGGPDGSLLLLFPNSVAPDNRISAGQTLTLPQSHWPLDTAEPAGVEHFVVIVSEHPRDFSHLSQERDAWL